VRIDGHNNIGAFGAADGKEPLGSAKPAVTKHQDQVSQQPADVAPENLEYVKKASAADDVNLSAVERARKMLESGELDSPEAAARAAKSLLSHGI
jgi:hypothetical protein